MSLRGFGTLSDGRPVHTASLGRPGGLQVEALDYGAIVHRLLVPTTAGPISVAVGFDGLAGYEADRAYHSGVVGRCANRIGGARFAIDGMESVVSANEGANCLHGGAVGWNKRLWAFDPDSADRGAGEDAVALTYSSPDGEEGFPGAVDARIELRLQGPMTLEIAYEARCDRPTPVNLTHHFYFNLDGGNQSDESGSDVRGHELTIAAEAYTPVRPDLIPTGKVAPVEGTPFDFRAPRPLGARLRDPQLKPGGGYDHNWALIPGAAPAVRLRSPASGVVLEVQTDQPGLQVYGGQAMGPPFHSYAAVVLELQGWPDAVNHPNFPPVVLRPGGVYRRRTRYRFQAGAPGPG